MITKNCSYRVVSNGEVSNLTTPCSFEKRGGISKITFSNGANSYAFLISKNAVTISTKGESQYSFILSKGLEQAFNLLSLFEWQRLSVSHRTKRITSAIHHASVHPHRPF